MAVWATDPDASSRHHLEEGLLGLLRLIGFLYPALAAVCLTLLGVMLVHEPPETRGFMIGLVGLVNYVVVLPGFSDPVAAFDRFYTENSQLFLCAYLIVPFALTGLAAAIASLHARGRLPVICCASIAAGGLVLLVMSGLQVL